MPFIGNQPAEKYSSFQKQDFTTSATTSYTLDHPVANGNEIALFINFVRQEPTAAYTASGTTLTLTSATSASDDMYCIYLGKAVQTVNPPSGSVGNSQVAASIITGQTALASEPADTDEFLISDAGTLKRIDYSLIKGGGITMADQWRVTANISANTNPISANLERVDTTGQGTLGTGMSVSSGVFTFPSTGIYLVQFNAMGMSDSNGDNIGMDLQVTTNNSTYTTVASNYCGNQGGQTVSIFGQSFIDVTDTSNVKVSFAVESIDSGSYLFGDTTGTTQNETYFTFIRLGDT